MLPLSVPHFTAQLRQELRTLATLAVLLTLSLLALQCVAPLPVRRHRDSTNMKLAVLLISLLFLATTTPMIEAKFCNSYWQETCKKFNLDVSTPCKGVCKGEKNNKRKCKKTCQKCKKRCA